jgi:hypothetical protein
MLFKILKLFGIDLPARMAEVWIDVEERFDLAKDSVEQAAQTAAVLGLAPEAVNDTHALLILPSHQMVQPRAATGSPDARFREIRT